MARVIALPLAGLLAVAAVFRALHPPPPPPARGMPVVTQSTPAVPEPESTPAPLPPAPAPPPAAFVEPVLTADELRPLLDARFSDETILAFARVSGRPFRPSPDDLASLRQAGMSDALLGGLTGATFDTTSPAAPPVVHVAPVITVYAPVTVTTVIEAPPPPPEPYISTVVLVPVGPPPLDAPRPPIYQQPSIFKTHEYMPTKRSPTAEEVARRDYARSTRIYR